MKIIIDADACPRSVLAQTLAAAAEKQVEVVTVANFSHEIDSGRHITVGGDPQETDLKIMNLAAPGDVVITQDAGLAAAVMCKKARPLAPSGTEYLERTMTARLEEREMKARAIRRGVHVKGPKKRTKGDDEKFAAALKKMLEEALPARPSETI